MIQGEVFDVAVDLREGSATFGKWHSVILSAENHKQFYISPGFAHGFLVLSEQAEICYKCTDFYHHGDEGGIAWNDPDVGIKWPDLDCELIMSESDEGQPTLKEYLACKLD